MTAWSGLTEEHTAHLAASALTPEIAEKHGIRSVTRVEDLPEEFQDYGDSILPAILFPWVQPDGEVLNQLKVPSDFQLPNGDRPKYLWKKGAAAQLGEIRKDNRAGTVLIIEGTKQSRAADAWASYEYAIYGIAGCRMWSQGGAPTENLEVVEDRDVVIVMDADASENAEVYDAAEALGKAVDFEGANSVKYAQLPAGKKTGLDDYLASRNEDKRRGVIDRLVTKAYTKPAERRPRPASKTEKKKEQAEEFYGTNTVIDEDGRREILHPGDNLSFHKMCLETFKAWGDGTTLFNYGEGLAMRRSDGLKPLDQKYVRWPLLEAMKPMKLGKNGDPEELRFDAVDCDMILSKAHEFSPLDRLSHSPFVREDGSICQTSGYDRESKTYLELDENFEHLDVPERPSAEDVKQARDLIEDHLIPNFPFAEEADKANAVALLLTPFIRGMVPVVPLAVIDGREPGVGKNLLADAISIVVTGREAGMRTFPSDGEEMRKRLTSDLRTGPEIMCFDEAHFITGEYLAQALTTSVWNDRFLGKTESVEYPNRATWISLGNNVRIGGDIGRRVYRINLAYDGEDPASRPTDYYVHPDLKEWAHQNRPALVKACLILVRAWFAQNCPNPDLPFIMGSFEKWQRFMGGILEAIGIEGFMDNVREWRAESDFDRQFWAAHFSWLYQTFEDSEFTSGQVKSELQSDPHADAPPEMSDTSAKDYAQKLGREYSGKVGRIIDGYRLTKRNGHANKARWKIQYVGDDNGFFAATGGPDPEDPPNNGPQPPNEEGPDDMNDALDVNKRLEEPSPEEQVEDFNAIVYDIETSGLDIHGYDGDEFVRLCGYEDSEGEPQTTTDVNAFIRDVLLRADRLIGHNILGFDNVALAVWNGADCLELAEKSEDTMNYARQYDPPHARGMKKGYYSLDNIGQRYGLGFKAHDLKALAEKHGGYDKIPKDYTDYIRYLKGDITLNRRVYDFYQKNLSDRDIAYVRRENKVMGRFARAGMEGFRVDSNLLQKRIDEGNARKKANYKRLEEEFGVPLGKWTEFKKKENKWIPHKSPLVTKEGKAALVKAFASCGVHYMKKTEKSKDISLNKDDMDELVATYSDPETLRKNKIDPDSIDLEKLNRLTDLIVSVTSERTVYKTIQDNLFGDRVYPKVIPSQASGRWSVVDPGLTVLGKREGRHVEREVFLPEEDHVLIAFDLDQVDARAIAWHCGDKAYQALFEPGKDLHSEIAQMVFGRSDGIWRDRAKVLGHGFNYGLGPGGAAKQTGVPLEVAQQFHDNMTERFPRLAEWKDEARAKVDNGDLLDNGFGRKMRPDRERAFTQGPALHGQGATRDILAEGILRLPEYIVPMLRVVIHDEAVFSIPKNRQEEVTSDILDAMQFWLGPIHITAGASKPGKNWGEVYEK